MNIDTTALDTLFDANPDIAKGLAAAYQVLLNGVPSVDGFTFLINQAKSTNFGSGGTTVFNSENIFINLFNNLVQGNAAAGSQFTSIAGGGSLSNQITALYNSFVPEAARSAGGLAFFNRSDATSFYAAAAAERGITSGNGAAIIAAAAILRVVVKDNIAGIGNSVNDLIAAAKSGTSMLTQGGVVLTPIETADGTASDADDIASASVPMVALTSTLASIAESTVTTNRTKVADIVVTGDPLGLASISLSGEDASLFEIVGSELFLRGGVTLDMTTNPSLDVSVNVDNTSIGTTPDDMAPLSIAVDGASGSKGTIINITEGGDRDSDNAVVSADGSKVVFESSAGNLTGDVDNFVRDVFLYDVASANLINLTGESIGHHSEHASISANGGIVVFQTEADELVPNDTNISSDIFLYKTSTGTLENLTIGATADGSDSVAPSVSADGSTVVFSSRASSLTPNDTNSNYDIFSYDVASSTFANLTSSGNGGSHNPSVSADGSKVVFESTSSNLTPGDTNNVNDIILYDVASATYTNLTAAADRISRNPVISADGNTIIFDSFANNLTANDTNSGIDIFVYDVATAVLTNLTAQGGVGSNLFPAISADAGRIAFSGDPKDFVTNPNPRDIGGLLVYDVANGSYTNLTTGNVGGLRPSLSVDGDIVAFDSFGSGLTPDDTNGRGDVFLFDFF